MEVVVWRPLQRKFGFSGGRAKNSNCLIWHCLYYIAFLLFFSHRAVYFACYSKAKEQFNSMFVPNSNIVHICSAGSAGKCSWFLLPLDCSPGPVCSQSRQCVHWYLRWRLWDAFLYLKGFMPSCCCYKTSSNPLNSWEIIRMAHTAGTGLPVCAGPGLTHQSWLISLVNCGL